MIPISLTPDINSNILTPDNNHNILTPDDNPTIVTDNNPNIVKIISISWPMILIPMPWLMFLYINIFYLPNIYYFWIKFYPDNNPNILTPDNNPNIPKICLWNWRQISYEWTGKAIRRIASDDVRETDVSRHHGVPLKPLHGPS